MLSNDLFLSLFSVTVYQESGAIMECLYTASDGLLLSECPVY